jgi:glycosyltransferase involved in cell wall biosynthesis
MTARRRPTIADASFSATARTAMVSPLPQGNFMAVLTILLPTYQGERYLGEQLKSILTQNFADFRLLAIDDGSSDGTRDLLAAAAHGDARVTVVPAAGNLGQRARLAQLADMVETAFVSVADQDDVWHPAKLSRLFAAIDGHAAAYGVSQIIDGEGGDLGYTLFDAMPPAPRTGDRLTLLFKPMASAHAMILRRPYFSPISLRRSQPFDWLQSLDAAFGDGLVYVADAVTLHRIHGDNQSNAVLDRRGRGRLAALRRNRNRRLSERWMTCHALEHLAFSSLVPADVANRCHRAHQRCVRAWFDVGRAAPLRDNELTRALIEDLAPLAGDAVDLATARTWIEKLATAPHHPATIARDIARTIAG